MKISTYRFARSVTLLFVFIIHSLENLLDLEVPIACSVTFHVHPSSLENLIDLEVSLGMQRCHTSFFMVHHHDSLEDLVDLVDLRVPRKEGALGHHLHQDRADRPEVDGRGVRLRSEEDFRRAVPEGNHLRVDTTHGRHTGCGRAPTRRTSGGGVGGAAVTHGKTRWDRTDTTDKAAEVWRW